MAVVEEVDPIMEKEVLSILGRNGIKMAVHGKLDHTLPMIYEYTPNIVMEMLETFLNQQIPKNQASNSDLSIPERPPTLCPGCPHRSVYYTVKDAVNSLGLNDVIYPTDIGCYTPWYHITLRCSRLPAIHGFIHRYPAVDFQRQPNKMWCVFIGDSTFFHAGIPPLINAVHNKDRFVLVILDNRTTAMTGGQPHPGLPVDGMGWGGSGSLNRCNC